MFPEYDSPFDGICTNNPRYSALNKWCMSGTDCQILYSPPLGNYPQGVLLSTPQSYYIAVVGKANFTIAQSTVGCTSGLSQAPFCQNYVNWQFLSRGSVASQDSYAQNFYSDLLSQISPSGNPPQISENCIRAIKTFACSFSFPSCSNGQVSGYGVTQSSCTDVESQCQFSLNSYNPQYSCSSGQFTQEKPSGATGITHLSIVTFVGVLLQLLYSLL